jgi:hypothetical protein
MMKILSGIYGIASALIVGAVAVSCCLAAAKVVVYLAWYWHPFKPAIFGA